MRASPVFQVSLVRFGVWRGAVGLLTVAGLAAVGAWLMSRDVPNDPALLGAAALSCVMLVGLGVSLAAMPAVSLRWDGLRWHAGAPGSMADSLVPGDLAVILDVGPWMLLRFTPAGSRAPYRKRWLPVQRRGLEGEWQALRCAVYAPRPAPAAQAPTGH